MFWYCIGVCHVAFASGIVDSLMLILFDFFCLFWCGYLCSSSATLRICLF